MLNRVNFMQSIRRSFGLRLMITFGLSLVIVLCMTSVVFIYNQNRALHERLLKKGRMLADVLSMNAVPSVFAENAKMADHDARSFLKQKDVIAIRITTSSGTVLYDDKKADPGSGMRDIIMELSGNSGTKWLDGPFEMREIGDAFVIRKPIIMRTPANPEEALFYDEIQLPATENVIGHVELVLDKRNLSRETFLLFLKGVPIAAVLIILSAVVMLWMVRRSLQPLDNLARAVDSLGREGAADRIPVETDDEIGRLAGSFNAMTDNLKRRESEKGALEERLRHAQKMEAVGTFARGIAHDFNNILATVKGSVFILEKKYFDHAEVRSRLEPIKNSLGKAKNLIEGLLTFSSRRKPDLQQIPLNIFVRKMGPAIQSVVGDTVDVQLETSENGMHIMADSIQMEQVLMNLAGNARDAMPDGGTLLIKTGMVQRPVRPDRQRASAERGVAGSDSAHMVTKDSEGQVDYAEISVKDSGTGMDGETRTKIFEPFFTTKETGKGTGLGLAIVYGIIDQHCGYIEVDSREGQGTEFRIYLPLVSVQDKQKEDG